MNHPYIEANNIIDRYLMGKLTEEESEAFQDHMLGCHQCLDELAIAERMQRGVREVFKSEVTQVVAPLTLLIAWWRALGTPRQGLIGILTLLILVGPSGYLWQSQQSLREVLAQNETKLAQLDQREVRPNVPIYRLSPQRGVSNTTFQISLTEPMLVLVLEVDLLEEAQLSASLRNSEQQTVWTTANLKLTDMGEVNIGLETKNLKEGTYHLTVEAEPADGKPFEAARFTFQATP